MDYQRGVYDPRAFILHAVSLRQAFAHCARFPVAATRRCMDRISVPFWGIMLSHPLPVLALVGHYPTNKLIGRRPLFWWIVTSFTPKGPCGITSDFSKLFPAKRYVPTCYSAVCRCRLTATARLACLRHTASARPEPGSNSQKKNFRD